MGDHVVKRATCAYMKYLPVIWAGLWRSLFPALRAANLPIATALRGV